MSKFNVDDRVRVKPEWRADQLTADYYIVQDTNPSFILVGDGSSAPKWWDEIRFELIEQVGDKGRKHSHYFKDVENLTEVDVYAVCDLFKVSDYSGAVHHAIKKLLLSGGRGGGKDYLTDLEEARDTLNRKIELVEKESEG